MILLLFITIIVTLITGKYFLKYLENKNYYQPIYGAALEGHISKSGTPTMGGIIILFSIISISLVILSIQSFNYLLTFASFLLIVLGYGYIGFRDDILKVTKSDNQSGLTPIQKLVLQFLISFIFICILYYSNWDTSINLLNLQLDLGLFYYIIIPIMIVGFSNATNLTDGIDGLLTSISIITFATLYFISIFLGKDLISWYILIVVGALIGFLIYNKNPAKMFMGDTGSLVIGALFAYFIILLKIEIVGILIGLIYIFETISVVLQVSYFKYTKKKFGEGRRIFLVAPYHHHLEKKGFSENKIVLIAVCVQLLISILSFAIVVLV